MVFVKQNIIKRETFASLPLFSFTNVSISSLLIPTMLQNSNLEQNKWTKNCIALKFIIFFHIVLIYPVWDLIPTY